MKNPSFSLILNSLSDTNLGCILPVFFLCTYEYILNVPFCLFNTVGLFYCDLTFYTSYSEWSFQVSASGYTSFFLSIACCSILSIDDPKLFNYAFSISGILGLKKTFFFKLTNSYSEYTCLYILVDIWNTSVG